MMRKAAALVLAAFVLAGLVVVGAARAAYTLADFQDAVSALLAVDPTIAPPANDPSQNFVTGGFGDVYGYNNGVSAQSDPSGTNVQGHLSSSNPAGSTSLEAGSRIRGDVICLAVSGKLAATGISGTLNGTPYTEVEVYRDGGPGGVGDGFNAFSVSDPEDCAGYLVAFAADASPITHGNILVNDAT
jgi:hypothetical protein